MKKLMVMMAVVATAFMAQATVQWSWWLNKSDATADMSLGIASRCKQVDALEISAFYSASPVKSGAQWTVFGLNDSDADCALQLAFVNRGKDPAVQLGFLNMSKGAIFDMGFVNIADASKFQLGFLNFNKKGFLPVFIFVNFDPGIFK